MAINPSSTAPEFPRKISRALAQVKRELQTSYEQAYPALREIIHLVLDEEESKAWKLSEFPHLLFPDLVEAHVTRLSLQPVETHHRAFTQPSDRTEFPMLQPAFA
jgi:hypothetical protein